MCPGISRSLAGPSEACSISSSLPTSFWSSMRSIPEDKRQRLLAELRALQNETTLNLEELGEIPAPPFDDEIKSDSYRAFIKNNPEWPAMYAEAKQLGIDPLDHWLAWLWKDETCAACGKNGHRHHPSCKCRRLCSGV